MGINTKRSHLWSIIVIGVVLIAYAFGAAINAMNAREAGVVYKRDEGVVLECVVTWNATGLDRLMGLAAEMDVPITFFMTAAFAKEHPERVAEMLDQGFEIGLLCSDAKALQAEAAQMSALGVDLTHVMPSQGTDSSVLDTAASELGLTTVLCTFELKNTTTDPAVLIKKVSESSFDGAIIRFQPAKTTIDAFSGMIETLRHMGLTLKALSGGNE
ncbi:MAG: polysaccharide deacetylase family protein [Christensenellales bacterium]|jgi:hypothetical protein